MIGDVNPDMQRLVQVTKECMEIGIAAAQPWKQLGDVAPPSRNMQKRTVSA